MKTIKVEMKPIDIHMEVDKKEFALALKTWRLRQGLLQREVAEKWGVSRYAIIKAENAQPISWMMAYRIFARLSDALKEDGEK